MMTTTTKTTARVSNLTSDKAAAVKCWQSYLQSNEDRLTAFYRMGEYLSDIKDCVPHGEFVPWMEDEGIHPRTAQRAMRIVKNDMLSFLLEAGSVHIALAAIGERDKPQPHEPDTQEEPITPIDHDEPEIESQSVVGPVKEQWLYDALALLRPVINDLCGLTVPEKIRISVGPTRRKRVLGFVHILEESSSDGYLEMVIGYEEMIEQNVLGTFSA